MTSAAAITTCVVPGEAVQSSCKRRLSEAVHVLACMLSSASELPGHAGTVKHRG